MNPENLMKELYKEIGLAEPSVQQYSSIDSIFKNYQDWKSKSQKRPFSAIYWEYQYPILHPYSYWAIYHLYEEGFQFDLTRSANKQGCYVCPNYVSTIDLKPSILYHRYLTATIEASKNKLPTEADKTVNKILEQYEDIFSDFDDIQHKEDPTCQISAFESMLLSNFSWAKVELDILKAMRNYVGAPVCDTHYKNLMALCDLNVMFITFNKYVLWSKLP